MAISVAVGPYKNPLVLGGAVGAAVGAPVGLRDLVAGALGAAHGDDAAPPDGAPSDGSAGDAI